MDKQGRTGTRSNSEPVNAIYKASTGYDPLRSRISKAEELHHNGHSSNLPRKEILGQPTPGIDNNLGVGYEANVFLVREVRIISS